MESKDLPEVIFLGLGKSPSDTKRTLRMEIFRQAQDDIAFKGVSKNNDDVMVSGMNEVNVVESISRKLLAGGSGKAPLDTTQSLWQETLRLRSG